MDRFLTSIMCSLAVVACEPINSDQLGEKLKRTGTAAYQVTLTRFNDGDGLVCQPFRVEITYDQQPDLPRQVLLAEQADDVVIAQTPSTLYVFYNELVLTSFFSSISDPKDAKPFLCDINIPLCVNEMAKLKAEGVRMHRVCGTRWLPQQ